MTLFSSVSSLGFRGVSRVLKALHGHLGTPSVPHFTTVRQWILKMGLFQISVRRVDKGEKWGWMIDFTVDVGSMKCLAVIGVKIESLKERENLTLKQEDVELLGLYPTPEANGAFVQACLEDVVEKTGSAPLFVTLDKGSDVTKGAKLYTQGEKKTVLIHDISHKMARLIEKKLKENEQWKRFVKCVTETKQKVQQTRDLAALMPPNLRSKARFMSLDVLMKWASRLEESKKAGRLETIPEERFNEHFSWLTELHPHLECWKQMVAVGEKAKEFIRTKGLSKKTCDELEGYLLERFPQSSSDVADFIDDVMNSVWEEADKLKARQRVLGSSEIIESIFGKYKQTNSTKLQGITISVLNIGAFMALKDQDNIKTAMESISIEQVIEWGRKKIGETLNSIRRKFFLYEKGNENGENFMEASIA